MSTPATEHINQAGLEIIMAFEGLRLKAYQDAVGVWTIGWGHTGPDVHAGLTISRARAEELLRRDVQRFESGIRTAVHVPLNANQFSALVSFAFNVGMGNVRSSTLLRLLNQGNYDGAAAQFGRWIKAGGRVLRGLVRRRAAERALFTSATHQGDWFDAATGADLARVIRKVLNEGVAHGQISWAGTSKAVLRTEQSIVNILRQQVITRL